MESLLLQDGTIKTDPVQIHNKVTEAFVEHFACPQHHIYSPLQVDDGIGHERTLTDKEYFKTKVAQFTKTLEGAFGSIWYGIFHVPQRPQLCTDMETIFDKEIMLDEFNAVVVAIASTYTAPSPTEPTFNMIKKWPEDVKKTTFTAHCNLWSAKEFSTQWKRKWICLKPKIDAGIPTANDLNLCLLDCPGSYGRDSS